MTTDVNKTDTAVQEIATLNIQMLTELNRHISWISVTNINF